MKSIFEQQAEFMQACGQTTRVQNTQQFDLYTDLIEEEYGELIEARSKVETVDALLDIIVVSIGALHSLGIDVEACWNEVMRSNMSKVDPVTGAVIKRADGKVIKPASYTPPNLAAILHPAQ